jgi:glycerol-3-phosphate O-acyltransferase
VINLSELLRTPSTEVVRPVDIEALLVGEAFVESVEKAAASDGIPVAEAHGRARAALSELESGMNTSAVRAWEAIGERFMTAYDVLFDETSLGRLRELDRKHSLVFLPSHRSQIDSWLVNAAIKGAGISPAYWFGGANMSFFPLGQLGRRSGIIFIPRQIAHDPVVRAALRGYVGELARNRVNLAWSIEGGRTRTGKLRPPKYGLMRYFVDGVEQTDGPEVLLVPVSVIYDQLHEVAATSSEAHGTAKRPEDINWLLDFYRQQKGTRLGDAYLDVGEPIPLRERLAQYAKSTAALSGADNAVERVSLQVCHRINRATPVTQTAAVTLALLAGDRALTLDEVIAEIAPTATYLAERQAPIAGGGVLTDRKSVRHTLTDLVRSGVVHMHDGGTEPVFSIAQGKHLVAAFYRNTLIHLLVNRAIVEIALVGASHAETDNVAEAERIAFALRDLLKFEFFFSERREFAAEMQQEAALIVEDWQQLGPDELGHRLSTAGPFVASLVLRPYLDAYQVVADGLAAVPEDESVDRTELLNWCLGVGEQRVLQRRIGSEESVSLELFRTAYKLAEYRGLLDPGAPDLALRRRGFAAEIAALRTGIDTVAELNRGLRKNER